MAVPSLLTGSIAGILGAAIGDLLRRIVSPGVGNITEVRASSNS